MNIKRYILLITPILIFFSLYSHAQSSSYPSPVFAAGGLYYNTGYAVQFPMLAMNIPDRSNHKSWTYTIDGAGKLPYDFNNSGAFPGVICPKGKCIAVGGYIDSLGKTYPMIAVSKHHFAHHWDYAIDKSFGKPSHYSNASFNSVACTENTKTCVAVGEYQLKTSTNIYPMIAVSLKGGAKGSWKFVDTTSDFPGSNINAYFNSVSCAGNTCTAGGQNVNNSASTSEPILVVNTRVGHHGSWNFVTTLPGDFNDGRTVNTFYSVTCLNSKYCIAGGQYYNGTNNYPMLAVNTNVHNSPWTYAISSNDKTLPDDCCDNSDSCSGNIYATSCSKHHCAVAGTYSVGASEFPMLATNTSLDKAQNNWFYDIDSTVLPYSYGGQGTFLDVSCSEKVCIAGGGYNGAVEYPMLAVSTDLQASNSWNYAIDAHPSTLPHQYKNGGSFYGVECNDHAMCFTQGYYTAEDDNYYPVLAENKRVLSQDSWHYPIDSTGPLPKQYGGYGLFCGSAAPLIVCPNGDFKK